METTETKLPEEQQEEICKTLEEAVKAIQRMAMIVLEIVKTIRDALVRIASELGRFFMKMQLLEWHVSPRLADFVVAKMPWYWAFRLGFRWFHRKMAYTDV